MKKFFRRFLLPSTMKIGYARISTQEQNIGLQIDSLHKLYDFKPSEKKEEERVERLIVRPVGFPVFKQELKRIFKYK